MMVKLRWEHPTVVMVNCRIRYFHKVAQQQPWPGLPAESEEQLSMKAEARCPRSPVHRRTQSAYGTHHRAGKRGRAESSKGSARDSAPRLTAALSPDILPRIYVRPSSGWAHQQPGAGGGLRALAGQRCGEADEGQGTWRGGAEYKPQNPYLYALATGGLPFRARLYVCARRRGITSEHL
jgi:hypothetical protein